MKSNPKTKTAELKTTCRYSGARASQTGWMPTIVSCLAIILSLTLVQSTSALQYIYHGTAGGHPNYKMTMQITLFGGAYVVTAQAYNGLNTFYEPNTTGGTFNTGNRTLDANNFLTLPAGFGVAPMTGILSGGPLGDCASTLTVSVPGYPVTIINGTPGFSIPLTFTLLPSPCTPPPPPPQPVKQPHLPPPCPTPPVVPTTYTGVGGCVYSTFQLTLTFQPNGDWAGQVSVKAATPFKDNVFNNYTYTVSGVVGPCATPVGSIVHLALVGASPGTPCQFGNPECDVAVDSYQHISCILRNLGDGVCTGCFVGASAP